VCVCVCVCVCICACVYVRLYIYIYIYIYIYYINGTEDPGYIGKALSSMDFSRLESDFWPLPKTYENGHLQKPSNIKQIELLGARVSDLGTFGMTFWFNLSSNFMIEQNLLICNTYNAKCLFLHLKALYFSIKTHSQKYAFSRCLPGHPFG
jgi:hypothetical protein